MGGCFLFFPGLVFNHLTPHLTWAAPAHERQGSGPHPLPLSLHSVYPMSPKFSTEPGPRGQCPRAVSPASSTLPCLNLRLLRGTGLQTNRHPSAPPAPTFLILSASSPQRSWDWTVNRPRRLPDLEVHTGGGGDPHPGQPQGLRLPLQGRCECAQARRQTGLACCSRGAPCPAGHKIASLLHAQGLCASEGVVRTSTRDARVCGNVVVCWREIPARLPSPLSPQPGGGGASTGGQAAASPPPSSPIGAKLGEGATPGNR